LNAFILPKIISTTHQLKILLYLCHIIALVMNEHSMNDLIHNFLSKNKKETLFNEQKIVELWYKSMGNFIVSNTKSVKIKNGVLYVQIMNASLKFELMGRRTDIIKKLNEEMGIEVVKDILFF